MPRAPLLWILAAVAGVLLVAGVTLAASPLSTQTIGLSSEPLTAGDAARAAGHRDGDPGAPTRRSAAKRRAHADADVVADGDAAPGRARPTATTTATAARPLGRRRLAGRGGARRGGDDD